jgi:copper(I)-binding protein
MRSILSIAAAAIMMTLASTGLSHAHEIKAGDLLLTDLWCRATPPGAKVAAAYLTIENKGKAPDRLVSVSSPVGNAAVHQMSMTNGVMSMRPVDGGIAIAPGQKVTLAPGGYHIMITDLKSPLKEGVGMLHVTLTFEKAGAVDATFHILSVGATGMGGKSGQMGPGSHSGMKM